MAEVELEQVHAFSPSRFREKKATHADTTGVRHIENKAILLVNDSIAMETADYYLDPDDGEVKTV